MRYELKNVYISSYNVSGAGSAAEPPVEVFSIAYTPIEVTYLRDDFDFANAQSANGEPRFEWIEIKAPPKPPSQPLPIVEDIDALAFVGDQNLEPMVGLLLPAVQQVREPSPLPPDETPLWDDFIFG